MITSILLILVAQDAGSKTVPAEKLDWHTMVLQQRGVDPAAPKALPDFGYVGLWRAIYGDREPGENEAAIENPGFAIDSGSDLDLDDAERRRRPRIRAARRLFQLQPWFNTPAFEVPIARLDEASAAFVYDHQLEQTQTIWSPNSRITPPTSPREYFGNESMLIDEDGQKDNAVDKTNIYLTVFIAIVATLLLGVIVCMPR